GQGVAAPGEVCQPWHTSPRPTRYANAVNALADRRGKPRPPNELGGPTRLPRRRLQDNRTSAPAPPGRPARTALRRAPPRPAPGPALVRGYSRQRDARRLDLAANAFLHDATAFWRLCEANNAVVPDALAARDLVGIPPTGP